MSIESYRPFYLITLHFYIKQPSWLRINSQKWRNYTKVTQNSVHKTDKPYII